MLIPVQNMRHEGPLVLSVSLSIQSVEARQAMFEHRVLLRNRRMRPQAVAKPDPIMPEGTSEWHKVKMECSLSETGLTEPVHDIRSIRRILVSCFEQCGQCISRCFQTSDSCMISMMGFAGRSGTAVLL